MTAVQAERHHHCDGELVVESFRVRQHGHEIGLLRRNDGVMI